MPFITSPTLLKMFKYLCPPLDNNRCDEHDYGDDVFNEFLSTTTK